MKKLVVITMCTAIVLLTACSEGESNVDDLFQSGNLVNNENVQETVNDAPERDVPDSDVPTVFEIIEPVESCPPENIVDDSHMQETLIPTDTVIVPEENVVLLESTLGRMTDAFPGLHDRHETGAVNYDLIVTENGVISVLSSPMSDVVGIFYDFDFNINTDSLETLHTKVSLFVSSVIGNEITPEYAQTIRDSINNVHPEMPEHNFMRLGNYTFTLKLTDTRMSIGH